ncbi:butyrophilin subfamily 3 member A1-like [Triplophysa dalaica]|uniref:butyrophilin subfamily 3 member A1-like n=1 Tax=Triplophysa dalaica TaxID=1582913 RepID=UPI0024DFEC92|nr:butyrophilin subfamily 3 member A1-like [Triplophysa dalaica]
MACAAEAQSTGLTLSEISLMTPQTKLKTFCSSFPAVKPSMAILPNQEIAKLICGACQTFVKVFPQLQGFNKCASRNHEASLDDSKHIIRGLDAELNRVVKFKKFSQMSEKIKHKGSMEEQQYYILHWAEELETTQKKQKEDTLLHEKKLTPSEKSRLESEINWERAKEILSDWTWKMKEMKENSVCPKREYKETLKDLYKQCKQGESSILPVMDWMMWTVLQSENCEESSPKMWMKKQKSKNTVGLPVPNSVWNWITKSTAFVVLDPNTANPDLQVSENRKSVIASNYNSDINHWDGFERKCSRYDGWTCVQAEEGYNTGRHYWEVNVRKKREWRVGVVKESAPRNGYVTMTPKAGYWNLRLQLGTVMALTAPVTKLYLPTPSRLGVYLDIDEGQVSFYDAEKRRHIYTFITDFSGTENIYPMFGTIETDRELRIL